MPSPLPPYTWYARVQRQQFDLPQPILGLGGSARVVLSGMAQRQTLPADAGDTANHYYICISHAALTGVILRCGSLTRAKTQGVTGQSRGEAGSPDATGALDSKVCSADHGGSAGDHAGEAHSAAEGISAEGRTDGKIEVKEGVQTPPQGILRLRWVVHVVVYPATLDPSPDWEKGDVESGSGRSLACERSPTYLKTFSDILCAEFLAKYAELSKPRKNKGNGLPVLLLATGPEGRALPSDAESGAVVGDFASEGRLDVVEASSDGVM